MTAVALVVAVAEFVARRRPQPSEGKPRAYPALDGLRAFLATGVVCSHLATYREWYFGRGGWNWPSNLLLRYAGEASVMLFFMITGFLFWGKAIASGGRVAPGPLLRNRFARLMPLYGLFVLIILGYVAARSGFILRVSPGRLAVEVARLALPGVFPKESINGVDPTMLTLQVWSLKFEWIFYLSVPVLCIFSRSTLRFLLLLALATAYLFWSAFLGWGPIITFAIGMATAHIRQRVEPRPWMQGRAVSALLLMGILAPLARGNGAQGKLGIVAFGLIFMATVFGNTFFGLLTLRGSRRLGDISYSIYLLHPPLLYLGLVTLDSLHPVASLGTLTYWFWALVLLGLVCLCAHFTYEVIEKPFLPRSASRSP